MFSFHFSPSTKHARLRLNYFNVLLSPLATCRKNQEQSIAWTDTKRVHYLSWLSETINILFSSCTFKPDSDSHASDLSLDACARATLDPFLPPRLTVRAPETLKRQSLADPNSKYFMTLQLHEIKSRRKPFIYIALSKGWKKKKKRGWEGGEVGISMNLPNSN